MGGGISGSGPSVFMLSKEENTALQVEEVMKDIFTNLHIDFHTYVTKINSEGVKIC